MGSPPQPLRLHLDTGSSDIWVESAQSELCRSPSDPCRTTGTFDGNQSSTFEIIAHDFGISYVDGEFAKGDYGKDVMHMNDGTVVKNLQFGIGHQASSTEGIMGIGFDQNEVQVQRLGKDPYRNLPQLMADQGLIRSNAYSLYLNDLEASTGEILFGGVDTAKFRGKLTTLPIDSRSGEKSPREFIITLTLLTLTNKDGKSFNLTNPDFAIPILLDTGSSYTYLPTDAANELSSQVGAQLDPRIGVPIVPCNIRDYNGSIGFGFSGAIVEVPLRELAVDAFQDDGRPATFNDGTPLCYFGVMDAGSDTSVLGDTFLRSAYCVFDLENKEISIGQTEYNVTKNNILEIGSGNNAVPEAVAAQNAVTVAATASAGTRINSFPTASGGATRTATPAITSTSQGHVVGISTGLTLACTIMMLLIS